VHRVLVICNPAAARTNSKMLQVALSALKAEGCAVEATETVPSSDAAELARAGVRDGVDAVVVYGGDGTTMNAVAGLVGHDVPIGLIPGGTGNLLAGNLRIPRNPATAARIVARGRTRTIDVGRIENLAGTRYFAVNCGAGFDAELMAGTSLAAKRRWGMGAYVGTVLGAARAVAPAPYRVTVDGNVMQMNAAVVLVANCAEIIPRVLSLGPDIALDDGLLDVVALTARGARQSLQVAWTLLSGTRREPWVRYARGREVTVEAEPARPVQLDGELGGHTPFTAVVVPRALPVLIP
jgi:diacylglycerol kinase (ATP)